jgi:RNA polymerase sigma factor (sigma-70 family)
LPLALREFSALDQIRLRKRCTDLLECVFDPRFARANAESLFAPQEELDEYLAVIRPQVDSTRRALTAAQEALYFTRYNYARYRMLRILEDFRGKRLTLTAARELLRWDEIARRLCDDIVQSNLGLVPTMIERSRVSGVDFGELISEGQLALLRSVEKFDCTRGFKFSTYACRSILTAIARAVALMARHRSHFPMEFDPDFQTGELMELREVYEDEDYIRALQSVLRENRADLTRTERRILSERFGFDAKLIPGKAANPKTLREVASIFGVTKERVRQIQNRALTKLRDALEPKPSLS